MSETSPGGGSAPASPATESPSEPTSPATAPTNPVAAGAGGATDTPRHARPATGGAAAPGGGAAGAASTAGAAGAGAAGAAAAGAGGPPNDDKRPPQPIVDLEVTAAKADAEKIIAGPTQDLLSEDPDKVKARIANRKAYEKAVAQKPDGELQVKYATAWQKLSDAATDLTRRAPNENKSRLQRWLQDQLGPGKPLYGLLAERRQLKRRYDARAGEREYAQLSARWETARRADNFKNWFDPVASIGTLIGTSADDIDRLNADIANNVDADFAIYRFWMVVAPRLIQLNNDKAVAAALPGLKDVRAALGFLDQDDPHVQGLMTAGERLYDGVYVIDPAQLGHQQEQALTDWGAALARQAHADAEYKLRPDDAASLKARLDAFAQGELDKAKAMLSDAIPS